MMQTKLLKDLVVSQQKTTESEEATFVVQDPERGKFYRFKEGEDYIRPTARRLDSLAPSDVRKTPELYLQHPRPSVLKDYFDPRLRKLMDVPRSLQQVKVTFDVEVSDVPAM
jgi:hypothetical protein